jgi:plasmid stability protein
VTDARTTDAGTTGADAAPSDVPSPIFSPSDSLETLWERAYQGEVLGETLFDAIADRLDDQGQARKMRVLATLERRTKEAIARSVERAGISTDPDPAMLELAAALAVDVSWQVLMTSTSAITLQYIPLYVRIGELDPSERAASDLLVAHEAALRGFADKELAGDGDTSLEAIEALEHMR